MTFEMEVKPKEFHGYSGTPTYRVWNSMRQRCHDSNHSAYYRYGARGIKVCDRWLESLAAFVEDMGERPRGMTIDRIDNEKGYFPGNCRWVTPRQQSRNRRDNLRISVGGRKRMAVDVAAENGVGAHMFYQRVNNGWTIEQAVGIDEHYIDGAVTIDGETMTKSQWAKKLGISRQAVDQRIRRGWSVEEALTTPRMSESERRNNGARSTRKMRPEGIGKLVSDRRVDLRLTQKQLSDIVGISSATLIKIETGRSTPSPVVAIKLAHVLSLTARDLAEVTT